MMRSWLASLALLATSASLALGVTQAGAAGLLTANRSAKMASGERVWRLSLSPAPDDLALAEIRFHGPARERLSASSLQLALSGETGDGYDYLAMAAPRFSTPGGPRALVLLVNRPSALEDPVAVQLRLSARRALGVPTTFKLANPFFHPKLARKPALCNLSLPGFTLDGSQLKALGSHGAPLVGFDVADSVAEAYDVACGLAFESAFKQAVAQPVVPPTPPTPTPVPPGCTPCDPSPGTACPLAVQPGICVASEMPGTRRAEASSH